MKWGSLDPCMQGEWHVKFAVMLPQAKQLPESGIFYGIFHARILVCSVQFLSRVWLFETPWTAARQASLSFTDSQCLIKLMSVDLVMPSKHVIPFSSHLQSFPALGLFPMNQFFESGGRSIGVSTSASVRPMNIQDWFPFWIDWLDLLAVQGTLKRLLQHHSSKASILQCSAFFIIHLSHPYWTLEWVEWVSISFSRGPCRDQTAVSCTAGRFFTTEPSGKLLEAIREALRWKVKSLQKRTHTFLEGYR